MTELQSPTPGLPTNEDASMEVEEEVMPIQGGGAFTTPAQPSPTGSILFYVDGTDLLGDTGTGLSLCPHPSPPLAWAPLAQGSGTSPASCHIFNQFVLSPEGLANCAASRFSSHTHQNHVLSLPTGNGGSKVGGEEDY